MSCAGNKQETPVVGSRKDAALAKAEGNEYFKSGLYQKAADCYSRAIELDLSNPILYGNRAQCYLNMQKPREAERDCDKAISLDSKFVKGYYRRGLARKSLNKLEFAMKDFLTAYELDPKNVQSENELNALKKVLASRDALLDRKSQEKSKLSKNIPKLSYFPTRIPCNSFEFYQDWREIDDDPKSKFDYLKMIGAKNLGTIFQASLEPLIWSETLNVLDKYADPQFALEVLLNLSRNNNFSTLVLFLDRNEKIILQRILERIQQESNLDKNDIATILNALKRQSWSSADHYKDISKKALRLTVKTRFVDDRVSIDDFDRKTTAQRKIY